MKDSEKNNFDKRGSELMPRELMERAADPALVPDEAREHFPKVGIFQNTNIVVKKGRLWYNYHDLCNLSSRWVYTGQ